MKTIVVANIKGGVGKSTISANLAIAAAQEGYSVLLVDSDPQGSTMAFHELRVETLGEKNTIQAVAITTPTINKVVPSFNNFDYVIVDVGGRETQVLRSAILAAAKGILIIPTAPSMYDIWATEDTFRILEDSRVYEDINACVFFNMVMSNTVIAKDSQESMKQLLEQYNLYSLNSTLSVRQDYKRSLTEGLGVIEYAPKSKSAEEVKALFKEIEKLI